ncbi:MAG: tRNA ((37)-N1)-methyltransferase TrmD [Pseudomonadota bacterium]
MFDNLLNFGITARANAKQLFELQAISPRDFTTDNYRRIDDKTFGGGAGMVMKIEPLELALIQAQQHQQAKGNLKPLVVYMSPQGQQVNQAIINQLVQQQGIIFVCGRYEGIDERFIQRNVDLELSIGDFVVSGGELPAMLVIDALIRQLPGAMNSQQSVNQDSFMNGLLDCPHYTQPRNYHGDLVPEILCSGNHKQIEQWRLQQSLLRTYQRRPELLQQRKLTKEESRLLNDLGIKLNSIVENKIK